MVAPIYIIAVSLAAAFALGIIGKAGRRVSFFFSTSAILANTLISCQWLLAFLQGRTGSETFTTAGGLSPYVIVLQVGLAEAVLLVMINIVGLLGAFYLYDKLLEHGYAAMATYVVALMGMNGIVLTGDIFNLFVFIEITAIAVTGLILFNRDLGAISAGFKYMIAGGIISGLLLTGIIFAYHLSGTLNLADMAQAQVYGAKGGVFALLLIVISLLLDLKPFPANGWGLDVYDAAHPGLSALISAASATVSWFALSKILPVAGESWYGYVAVIGIITFVFSNLLALKQTGARRLLGYSSIGQAGLVTAVLGLRPALGPSFEFIALGLLLGNYLAKAGLFWLAGIVRENDIEKWSLLRKNPLLMILFGTFVFALVGFPPFPVFYAKWELVLGLAREGHLVWIGLILFGSFLEGVYLFRWFGKALKLENRELPEPRARLHQLLGPVLFGIAAYGLGYYFGLQTDGMQEFNYLPLLFIVFMACIDFLPARIKNTVAIAGVAFYAYTAFPHYQGDLFRTIFAVIFLGGALLSLFSGYYHKGRRTGFYPMALAMFAGLAILLEAQNLLQFLFGWELMAVGSYFLLIRGEKSMPHGYSYMLFSLGGSYAILAGFALASAGGGHIALSSLIGISVMPALAYALIIAGFLTKTAAIGLHIWLPGAHSEAPADVSFMASAILLKAGVFGLVLTLIGMGSTAGYAKYILLALGWIGVFSALFGNMAAVYQESSKRLLAWSSIGQLGYIVFGLATMTHFGWLASLVYSLIHFLYKGILFLVIGGIAMKTGSSYMYKTGGLIKRMPLSFVAVLMSIIALAGIPPLVGFVGKWLFYNLIISGRFYFQGFLISISGIIAFLYLFRLIYSIFLGQLKDNHRRIKELSVWMHIPVYIMILVIMYLSTFPHVFLEPMGRMLSGFFPENAVSWNGQLATTSLGHFNGTLIMFIVGAVFAAVLAWLLAVNRKAQKVKQFDIFYSGERPTRPELSHLGYNFFAHYRKAVGFLAVPLVRNFWDWAADVVHDLADFFRRIYSGNGQSYALHLVLFVAIVSIFAIGG